MATLKRKKSDGTYEYIGMPVNVGMSPQTLGYAETITPILGQSAGGLLYPGLNVTVVVPAGRRLRVSVLALTQSNQAGYHAVEILQDGTNINRSYFDNTTANQIVTHTPSAIISPTAGSHTYTVRVAWGAGSGGNRTHAAALNPEFILVEDITGSTLPYQPASVPVGVLAQAKKTVNQGSLTTGTWNAIPELTANVAVPAGRVLKITANAHVGNTNVGGAGVRIRMDGATIQESYAYSTQATSGFNCVAIVTNSPSAGAHVFDVAIWPLQGGTGVLTASATMPAELIIEDVTPTPAPSSGAPSSTLGYAIQTATQSGITTATDLAGASVAVTVPGGRRLRISASIKATRTVPDGTTRMHIQEGASVLQIVDGQPNIANDVMTMTGSVVVTPSAGVHTYKLTLSRVTGTGTVGSTVSAADVGFILVEDITGSVWPAGSAVTAGMVASEAWTTFNAVPRPSASGAFTTASGAGAYVKIGSTVHYRYAATITTVGTGTGDVTFDLPVMPAGISTGTMGFGRENGLSGNILVVYYGGGDDAHIRAPAALASGQIYAVSGTYEAAS